MVKLYHITTKSSADKIMQEGFNPSNPNVKGNGFSFFFTDRENIRKWVEKLRNERKRENFEWYKFDIAIIEISLDKDFLDKNFNVSGDEYRYKGFVEKLDENFKWVKTQVVPLINGVNCTIRIMQDLANPMKQEDYEKRYDRWKTAQVIKLYRGESVYNKGGRFYTTNREWARQFTQSGLESEIKSIKYPEEAIYKANPLPEATNEKQFDDAIEEARANGFKAFWVDEGVGEPNSVYFI